MPIMPWQEDLVDISHWQIRVLLDNIDDGDDDQDESLHKQDPLCQDIAEEVVVVSKTDTVVDPWAVVVVRIVWQSGHN